MNQVNHKRKGKSEGKSQLHTVRKLRSSELLQKNLKREDRTRNEAGDMMRMSITEGKAVCLSKVQFIVSVQLPLTVH